MRGKIRCTTGQRAWHRLAVATFGLMVYFGYKSKGNNSAIEAAKNALRNMPQSQLPISSSLASGMSSSGSQLPSCKVPKEIQVSQHIRTLHEGWSASPDAIERALNANMPLAKNQTYVSSYTRSLPAA